MSFKSILGEQMGHEHSAGAVIFRRENGQVLYLILHYEEGHWGCAKGHTENTETVEQTARREIREETGLTDLTFMPGFVELNQYSFMSQGQIIDKTVTMLLADSAGSHITLSDEHLGSEWLPFEAALERITYPNEKELFKKAHQNLMEKQNK
jgi:bis(5'-nucleosidyl)-tetraphosphatase